MTPRPAPRSAVSISSFLFPALMGLFAQVGGTGTTTIWRISFVAIAVIGLLATLRALPHSRRSNVDDTLNRLLAIVLYTLIAVVGVVPEIGGWFDLKAIQVEAVLLILLVLLAHGLVWRFMTSEPPAGRHGAMSRPD